MWKKDTLIFATSKTKIWKNKCWQVDEVKMDMTTVFCGTYSLGESYYLWKTLKTVFWKVVENSSVQNQTKFFSNKQIIVGSLTSSFSYYRQTPCRLSTSLCNVSRIPALVFYMWFLDKTFFTVSSLSYKVHPSFLNGGSRIPASWYGNIL